MSTAQKESQEIPTPKDRVKIIASIKKLVAERHINVSNPHQDYAPWLALVDQRTPELLNMERPAFEAGLSALINSRTPVAGAGSSQKRHRQLGVLASVN